MELADGTVIPSFLNTSSSLTGVVQDSSYDDFSIRVGRVLEALPTTSSDNINKVFVEYNVVVNYAESRSGFAPYVYTNVKVMSTFGRYCGLF